jgi:long-chain acyl-CoA synthetase
MHPGVLECAVIGVPDTASGEAGEGLRGAARPGAHRAELMKFVAEQLTNYKRPKIVEFRDELPKTPVGKILRRALRDEVVKKAAA